MAKGGSAPAPTPPGQTAKADFGAETATAGHAIEHGTPNQFSPAGSVTFNKYNLPEVSLGSGETVPGGQGVSSVTTAFSPDFQNVFDTLTSKGANLAGLLPSSGFTPTTDTAGLRQSYIDEGMADVRPQWDREDDAFGVTAAERGIPIGSEIWNNERNRVGEQRDTYQKSLSNQAWQAAANEDSRQFAQQLTEHQVPASDFSNFYNAVQGMQAGLQGRDSPLIASSVTAPDMAAITARYDQQRNQQWQAKQAASGSALSSGLGLLGGVMGMFSDERVKEDATPVGKTKDGQTIYRFRYKGDPTWHMGLMAQEVEKAHPEAVGELGGIKTVDIRKATAGSEMGLLPKRMAA